MITDPEGFVEHDVDRYPYPLYPVGTRVRHNMSESAGVVVGHQNNRLVVRYDEGGWVYESSQWNWHLERTHEYP